MSDPEEAAEGFQVRCYVWYESEGEQHACEPLSTNWVHATDAGEALATAQQGKGPIEADRFLVDVQRTGLSPKDKVVDGVRWQIVALQLTGVGEQEAAIREHLERTVPRFVMERDRFDRLRIAAALPGYLDWEGMDDLEAVLEEVLGDDVYTAMNGGSEDHVGLDVPSSDELWAEVKGSRPTRRRTTTTLPDPPDGEPERLTSEGPPNRELHCRLLRFMEQGEVPDVAALAEGCRRTVPAVEQALADIDRWGLGAVVGPAREGRLSYAGEQFLSLEGRVSLETLDFFAGGPVDDLHAREAIRRGSTRLLHELCDACVAGTLVDHVRALVPPTFVAAVDLALASRFHAAASALVVRLARAEPAGCVAEEIIAVRLIQHARDLLADWQDALGEQSVAHAANELAGIFELFQADDVFPMFDRAEESPGPWDRRLDAWFKPFSGTIAAGHLEDPRPGR
jgi:hypothetical protein